MFRRALAAAATVVLLTPSPALADHDDDDDGSEICVFRVGIRVGDFEVEGELCLGGDD
ncbi:MAG: hypothetical protein M3357_03055 [Actinomycetota bacterium]|nr:hypothetical protein [Actinomycetota bacterium]